MSAKGNDKQYIFEMPIRVRDYEVDVQGIVNNANYLHYLELTRHEFCRTNGVSFAEMHYQGIDPVLRKVEIEYISPLGLSELMVSKLNMRRDGPRFIFEQDVYRENGAISVRAIVTVVCLENGRLSRGDELAAAFSKFID